MIKPMNVSAAQQTPEGSLIRSLYYNGVLEKLLKRNEYYGCPHNGDEHTLCLRLAKPDVESFLLLIKDHYEKMGPVWAERAEAFVAHVESKPMFLR